MHITNYQSCLCDSNLIHSDKIGALRRMFLNGVLPVRVLAAKSKMERILKCTDLGERLG